MADADIVYRLIDHRIRTIWTVRKAERGYYCLQIVRSGARYAMFASDLDSALDLLDIHRRWWNEEADDKPARRKQDWSPRESA